MASEYSASSSRLSKRHVLLVAFAAITAMIGFQVASAIKYRIGFPLDDSWIHLTYARNLALAGEWAFKLGAPSAGSTAPLWTLLLAPGFVIGLGPPWWTLILGAAILISLGVMSEWIVRKVVDRYRPSLPWVGLFTVAEWHLVWAASSGMETLLHALLATSVLALLLAGARSPAAMGLLVGLSVWVRPDGLLLSGPVCAAIALGAASKCARLRQLAEFLLAFGAVVVPYLVFNLWLSGTPMPNTFYAKQAEYAAWQARPAALRLGIGLTQIAAGPFSLLLPGLVAAALVAARRRDVPVLAALAWAAGYVALYLSRLPAYQHGRYLMPVMPILFVLGMIGYLHLQGRLTNRERGWMLASVWKWSLVLLTTGFLILGARSYADDVALIESEMVQTALWVSEHAPVDAVVAAHDIGALGYYDQHALVDLAGLVSPEVVPIIRDERSLAELLDAREADYLIAFPNLYAELTADLPVWYSTGGPFAPAGMGNMTVYCWSCR